MKDAFVIAIIGKAASGKDTFARKLANAFGEKANLVVSTTTRPKRVKETDGIDYHFVDETTFHMKEFNHSFLETNKFRGWYYGIERTAIDKDKVNIAVVDMRGLYHLSCFYNILPIYMHAPVITRVKRYIDRNRGFSFEMFRRLLTDTIVFWMVTKKKLRECYGSLISVDSTKDYSSTIQTILDMV